MTPQQGRVLVIGVGNRFRRDDGAGLVAARQIRDRLSSCGGDRPVTVIEHTGEGTSLIAAWNQADTVYLIDAVASTGAAGAIHCWDATEQAPPADALRCSTHAVGIGDAIQLAQALGQLPRRLVVFGIEGQCFEFGEGLTAPVQQSIGRVVDRIVAEIAAAELS